MTWSSDVRTPSIAVEERVITAPAGRSDVSATPATAHTLWVGGPLPRLAHACLKSFVRVGQRIVLHSYDRPDVPPGVELADAALILGEDTLSRYAASGNYPMFSDIFRYLLLQQGADLWVDCDVFCLKPIPRAPYLYGWESDRQIASGVLSLPADSDLLKAMIGFAEKPGIPPWVSRRRRAYLRLRRTLGRPLDSTALPWGTIGPRALTYFAKQQGRDGLAWASDYLYPVAHQQSARFLEADLTLDDLVTSRTICLHVYATHLARHVDTAAPSSPLGRILAA